MTLPSPMIQDFQQTTMAYCVMQVAALPTGCEMELCHYRQTPPTTTTTAAAAAVLVTDRHRHLPPRTPAPLRKQLSRMSALARVSYGRHVSGEGANVEYRRRRPPTCVARQACEHSIVDCRAQSQQQDTHSKTGRLD